MASNLPPEVNEDKLDETHAQINLENDETQFAIDHTLFPNLLFLNEEFDQKMWGSLEGFYIFYYIGELRFPAWQDLLKKNSDNGINTGIIFISQTNPEGSIQRPENEPFCVLSFQGSQTAESISEFAVVARFSGDPELLTDTPPGRRMGFKNADYAQKVFDINCDQSMKIGEFKQIFRSQKGAEIAIAQVTQLHFSPICLRSIIDGHIRPECFSLQPKVIPEQ